MVNRAIYHGKLGQDQRPEQERFKYLEFRAAKGDAGAQKWVSDDQTAGVLMPQLKDLTSASIKDYFTFTTPSSFIQQVSEDLKKRKIDLLQLAC